MSTFAYATLTARREEAKPGTSDKPNVADPANPQAGKPGVTMWLDAAAALVPAEVLAIHAFMIPQVTDTTTGPGGKAVITITNVGNAQVLFWVLAVLAALLYVFSHRGHWDNWDFARMLIPSLAFFLWCALQSGTAFDGVAHWSEFARILTGVVGVVVLGAIAQRLAKKADAQT